MEKIVFEIKPLSCAGCAKKIEDRLLDHQGVVAVNVYGRLGKILVGYKEAETNADQLEKIFLALDFPIKTKITT